MQELPHAKAYQEPIDCEPASGGQTLLQASVAQTGCDDAGSEFAVRQPRSPLLRTGLNRAELKRRMWHMAPGLLPFVLWPIPHSDPLSSTLTLIVVAVATVLGVAIIARHATIARPGERSCTDSVIGYAGAVVAGLLLFPAHAEIGLTVLAVLAFGDGAATWGGLALQGPRLPWNGKKTWAGAASFILCAVPMATVTYWGEAQPSVPLLTAAACCVPAVIVAGVAETLPLRLDDNVRVGAAALGTLALMQTLVPGWS